MWLGHQLSFPLDVSLHGFHSHHWQHTLINVFQRSPPLEEANSQKELEKYKRERANRPRSHCLRDIEVIC